MHSKDIRNRCTYLKALITEHPYYIGRNSGSVDLINVATGRLRALIRTELSDRQYFESCAVVENYGQTYKIYYIEEESINERGDFSN